MLGKIFGSIVGGGVVSAAEGVANIIDQFVETDDEKRAAEVIKASPLINASTFRNWYEAYIQYCTVKKGGFGLCDTCGSTMVNGFVFLLF